MNEFTERFHRHREQERLIKKLENENMQLNAALDAALVQAEADKKTIADDGAKIATLQAEIAAAPQADPVKAKKLADAVMGVDTATLPEPPAA